MYIFIGQTRLQRQTEVELQIVRPRHYRDISGELKTLAQGYPVVTVVGPRQSGKTTLVRLAFPEKTYTNLENPDIRSLADTDPRSFLEQFPNGAILDEIQRVPKLLSYIQTIVDEKEQKGLFILTGSHCKSKSIERLGQSRASILISVLRFFIKRGSYNLKFSFSLSLQ